MTEQFVIPYPNTDAGRKRWAQKYGLNAYYAGKHWAQRKEDAEFWHTLTRAAMNTQRVRRNPFDRPVFIFFYWNDRLDIDNHAVMGKMIVDAMKGRIIKDDSRRYLKGVCHFWCNDSNIHVVIKEVEQNG